MLQKQQIDVDNADDKMKGCIGNTNDVAKEGEKDNESNGDKSD